MEKYNSCQKDGRTREDHVVLKEKREDYEVWGKKGEDHAALAE